MLKLSIQVDHIVFAEAKSTTGLPVLGAKDPPCTGCGNFNRCQVLRITCVAWIHYIRFGFWFDEDIGSIPDLSHLR